MTEMALKRRADALRGRRLEYFTIAWNSLEGLIAIAAGVTAGSISLVGFGVDSFIEVTSGSALLWRMSMDADVESRERVERLTLRIVGCCFLALAGYVAWEAVSDLASRRAPAHSPVGVALALVSLVVMPLLSRAKRRVGRALGSGAMQADATQTQLCAYLSAILLGGLLLNVFWDLWWADPLAGLLMVPIIGREGIEALRGEGCECD
jgi:divalent metal cation (Fe/Co/Zn/Cd) transporter